MADFCRQCTIEVFGQAFADKNDMAGLCDEDEVTGVLCEHCGPTWCDYTGTCIYECHAGHQTVREGEWPYFEGVL